MDTKHTKDLQHPPEVQAKILEILCADARGLEAEAFDLVHCGAALEKVEVGKLSLEYHLSHNSKIHFRFTNFSMFSIALAPLGKT